MRFRAAVRGPQPGENRIPGDALKRRRSDKSHRGRSHRDAHLASALGQRGREVDDFIRGDAAGDQNGDAQASQLLWNWGFIERHQSVPPPMLLASSRFRRPGASGAEASVKGPGAPSSRISDALLAAPPLGRSLGA